MFFDVLNLLCKVNNTTVTAFAVEMGLSKSSPTNWKRGVSPNSDVVVRAAKRFGVSTDYLLGLDDVPSRSNQPGYTKEEFDLIRDLRAAEPQVRSAAINSMYAVIESFEQEKELIKSSSSVLENDESRRGAV